MGGGVKAEVKLGISYSDTMLNYRLSQKLKLLGNDKDLLDFLGYSTK